MWEDKFFAIDFFFEHSQYSFEADNLTIKHNDGHAAWVVTDETGIKLVGEKLAELKPVGIVADEKYAEQIATEICKKTPGRYSYRHGLNAYMLKTPKLNLKIPVRKMMESDTEMVANMLAEFQFFALGVALEGDQAEVMADALIDAQTLYGVEIDGEIVAIANVDFTEKYGKLSYVYTKDDKRGKGYARAVTSHVVDMILRKNKIPCLYAEVDNEISNGLYKSMGFEYIGRLLEFNLDL